MNDKLIAMLAERNSTWKPSTGNVCAGALVKPDGTIRSDGHSACHSWVSDAFRSQYCYKTGKDNQPEYPYVALNCYKRGVIEDALVDWLMSSDMPLSKYITYRDDNGVMIQIDKDAITWGQGLWLCKAMRYAVEAAANAKAWYELVSSGTHPLFALFVASRVIYTSNNFRAGDASSHVNVFPSSGYDYTKNKNFKRSWELSGLFNYELNPKSESTFEVWGKETKINTLDLSSLMAAVAIDDGWGGKINTGGCDKQTFLSRINAIQNGG